MSNWNRFSNIFPGCPTLTGTAGDLATVLDLLANGSTAQTLSGITRSGSTATATVAGLSITGITRSGTTATATCAAAHGITVGATVQRVIAGATQSDYNGEFAVTATTTTQFTYTVANSPTTPATGTITYAGHGLPNGLKGWRTIAGATETEYNGTFQITAVTANTFTYTVTGTPSTPATGSPTFKIPAAGWTIEFTATNKRAYRNGSGATSRSYMRLVDTGLGTGGAKEAAIKGYVTMSDIDTGTGPFPTNTQSTLFQNSEIIRKSASADTVTRTWELWCDDRTFDLLIQTGDTANVWSLSTFGEYYSPVSVDTTASLIAARHAENVATYTTESAAVIESAASCYQGLANASHFTRGDKDGFNNSTVFGVAPPPFVQASSYTVNGVMAYPNLGDGGLYLWPYVMYQANGTSSTPRVAGIMRGFLFVNHPASYFTDGDVFTGAGDYTGRSFLIRKNVAAIGGNTMVLAFERDSNPPYST